MIASAGPGIYQPGKSFLHQVDSRIKVISTLIMVMLTFAASTWGHIVIVAAIITNVLVTKRESIGTFWRLFWLLRWLLLFTFLIHILFTPGRTLWGTSWLSYDGMLIGVFVCMQLSLAVLLATIMALTTSVEDIVGAFGWMVSPLARIGVNTADWEKMILLALNFIPVVYDQIERSGTTSTCDEIPEHKSQNFQWFRWAHRVKLFVLSLVEQGDKVAHELAVEESPQNPSGNLKPLLPLTLLDKLFVLSLGTVVFGYWLAGKLA